MAVLNDAGRAYGPGYRECAIIRDEVAGIRPLASSAAHRLYRLILDEHDFTPGDQHHDIMQPRQWLAEPAWPADGPRKPFLQYKNAVSDLPRSQEPDHPDALRAKERARRRVPQCASNGATGADV
jgi:hypothetical protein